MQHLGEFQTEIIGSLMKLTAFEASLGHPPKLAKLPRKNKNIHFISLRSHNMTFEVMT